MYMYIYLHIFNLAFIGITITIYHKSFISTTTSTRYCAFVMFFVVINNAYIMHIFNELIKRSLDESDEVS